MDWNDHEKQALLDTHNESEDEREQVWMTARRAVELAAERGGEVVELPDGFEEVLREMETRGTKREAQAAVTVRGLLASHRSQSATVATLQAKVAELESDLTRLLQEVSSGYVVGDLYRTTAGRGVADAVAGSLAEATKERMGLSAERDSLRVEAERLKADVELGCRIANQKHDALLDAESRLAAIRERGGSPNGLYTRFIDGLKRGNGRAALLEVGRWMLEGDAPQEARGDGRAPRTRDHARLPDEMTHYPVRDLVETLTVSMGMAGTAPTTTHHVRYPCSTTCTHDDAATPGHPERVKERSEAVIAAAASLGDTAEGLEEMSRTIADHNRHVDSMGGPVDVPEDFDWGENEPDPAERMRAAIRKEVAEWAQASLGEVPTSLMLVIDEATP